MLSIDAVLERLAPLVEWAVFRSRRIAAAIVVGILCCMLLFRGWRSLAAVGRSPVQGRVTAAGRPVTFGTVTIVTANGSVLTAPIKPDGTYVLPHVPPGPIQVAVSSPEPRSVFQKALDSPSTSVTPKGPPGTGAPRTTPPKQGKPADDARGTTIAVRVDAPPPSTQSAVLPVHAGWFRIPGRYADPVRSGLKGTVAPEGSTLDLAIDPAIAIGPQTSP
jgi:hypothetical protein